MRAYREDLNSLQYVDFGDISSSFDQFCQFSPSNIEKFVSE